MKHKWLTMQRIALGMVSSFALFVAAINMSRCCYAFMHQDAPPESMNRFRRYQ